MCNRKKIFIHIGYPKTATTTLQKHYFPFLDGVNYLGVFYDKHSRNFFSPNIVNALIHCDEDFLISQSKEFSEGLFELLDDRPVLYSNEGIANQFLAPRMNSRREHVPTSPELSARAIKLLFDESLFDVKIIITVRNQVEALQSLYAQSYAGYFHKIESLDSFDKFIDKVINEEIFLSKNFHYEYVLSCYAKIFGKGNVGQFSYELLVSDRKKFFDNLLAFIGVNYSDMLNENRYENLTVKRNDYREVKPKTLYHVLNKFRKSFFPNFKVNVGLGKALRRFNVNYFKGNNVVRITKLQEEKLKSVFKYQED